MTEKTSPGAGPTSGASGSAPAVDWAKMVDALGSLGSDVVKRFSERASSNAAKVRDGAYGKDDLIDDAEWFWKNLAADAKTGLEIWRTNPPAP